MWNVKIVPIGVLCITKSCINRNIVECKEAKKLDGIVTKCVLIETLWNVKKVTKFVYAFTRTVLIETLWNVKLEIN